MSKAEFLERVKELFRELFTGELGARIALKFPVGVVLPDYYQRVVDSYLKKDRRI